MTLRHIRIFVEVYEEKSITGAARRLEMAQPAVSLAVREMETHYGTKLFERSGRGIRPTEAAAHLYEDAARLISLYEEMDRKMKNWDRAGELRIGSSISIGSCILPRLVRDFSRNYPDLDVFVRINSSDIIEQDILSDRLDFGLIEGRIHSEKIHARVFMDDELIPVCSRFHPLADRKDVPLEALAGERFLMREKNSGTRELAESNFAVKGFHIRPVWESSSTAALISAVSEGLGISVLPKRMLEKELRSRRICSFSIRDLDLARPYFIIYHENKYISPVMEDFFRMAMERELHPHEQP